MKKFFTLASSVLIGAVFISATAFAKPTPQMKADAAQINTACAADAQTSGCGGEIVGKGLLKCLHHFREGQRQTNKDFVFSAPCEAAVKQLHNDRAAASK